MKNLWVIPLLACMATSPTVLAAAAKSTNSTQAQIDELTKRISELEKQDDVDETRNYMIGTDMQFGVGSGTYSDEIYLIDFGLNRDLSLLHERQYIASKFKSFEKAPHLLISGEISGTAGKHSSPFGIMDAEHQQFMKAEALMDFTAYVNPDWLGYFELDAIADAGDTSITTRQAFATWGNFDKTPMYVTVGYQFVPFGSYTTNFIDATMVQELGRTQVPATTGAFNIVTKKDLEVNGAVFWFAGDTKDSEHYRLDQMGANIQARQQKLGPKKDMSIMGGVSFINNLASSNGIEDDVIADLDATLDHYIPAVDARVKFMKAAFSLTGEYLAAVREFAEEDITQGSISGTQDGARPTGAYVEAAYDHAVWKMPATISGRWGQTQDSLAFGLPYEEWGLSYQLKPFFNTRVTFEYLHRIDYSESTEYTANSGAIVETGTGQSDDLFQAQVNVYF